MEEIKFTAEEIERINKLQDDYAKVTATLGRLAVQEILITQELDKLRNSVSKYKQDYVILQDTETSLIEELNKKYGEGTLDLESGVFIPNK